MRPILKAIVDWIKSLIGIPNQKQIQEQLACAIYRDLREQRQGFKFETTIARYDASEEDSHASRRLVYKRMLTVVWKDGFVDESEKKLLAAIARLLEFPDGLATRMNIDAARDRFGKAYEKALADGVIEDHEQEYLDHVADVAGFDDYNAFMGTYFYEQTDAGRADAAAEAAEEARFAAIARSRAEAAEAERLRRQRSTRLWSNFGSTHVRGYYRKDGTYVQPHTRRR